MTITESDIVQNLRDAGCDKQVIESFMAAYEAGDKEKGLRTLAKHRKFILGKLHESQEKIDCLDFLVYQIKKETV